MNIPGIGTISFSSKIAKPVLDQQRAYANIDSIVSSAFNGFRKYSDDLNKDLQTYFDMMNDAQIQAALGQFNGLLLGDGWQVKAADVDDADRDEAQRQADFIEYCFRNSQGSFDDNLLDALTAVPMGFSCQEIIWQEETGGKWTGFITLKALKSIDPRTIEIQQDPYGNVLSLRQPSVAESLAEPYPIEKFVLFTYLSPFCNPYGKSILRAAYKNWWFKDLASRLYVVYMKRVGTPIHVGKYKRGATKDQQTELLAILAKLQDETGIIVPEDTVLDLVSAVSGGHDAYLRCIEFHNQEIVKAILGQTLTSSEGQRVGSMALGKVHLDILRASLRISRGRLTETYNDQLIRRLVDYNFGLESRFYPTLEIIPPQADSLGDYMDALYKASNLPITVVGDDDIDDIRKRLDLTAAKPEPLIPEPTASKPEPLAAGDRTKEQPIEADAQAV